jgi:hypothetical protein
VPGRLAAARIAVAVCAWAHGFEIATTIGGAAAEFHAERRAGRVSSWSKDGGRELVGGVAEIELEAQLLADPEHQVDRVV